jgi:uncharacterized protein YbjT (DUF2867 family)
MGATGNTGNPIVLKLIKEGCQVRALGRSSDKLKPLAEQGAQTLCGDASDAAYLSRAFAGAEAAYVMIPPLFQTDDFLAYQNSVGESIRKALSASGVRHVVLLSSLGAEQSVGTGPIVGLHLLESRLRELPGLNVLFLRAGYFFENHFGSLSMIKQKGINGGAIAPDVPIGQIATRDIADAAASALLKCDFSGVVVRELLGSRDLSMAEATRIIGAKIGKPDLKYVQFPYDAFADALLQIGFSANIAGLFAEMSRAINDGRVHSLEGRNERNTTGTTFEVFADTLAAAYKAQ